MAATFDNGVAEDLAFELSLEDLLHDPIILTLMRRDRVSPAEVRDTLVRALAPCLADRERQVAGANADLVPAG